MSNKLLMRFLPFLAWFPVSTIILRGDLIAGITGALVLVPKAMAYARLSGLPLYFGLYTAFVPAILGALWGSSRQLATGPVAIISLMTAVAITPLATPYTDEYVSILPCCSLFWWASFSSSWGRLSSAVSSTSSRIRLFWAS